MRQRTIVLGIAGLCLAATAVAQQPGPPTDRAAAPPVAGPPGARPRPGLEARMAEMSPEEREAFRERMQTRREARRARWEAMTPEERQAHREAWQARREERQARWDAMSEEERAAARARMQEGRESRRETMRPEDREALRQRGEGKGRRQGS